MMGTLSVFIWLTVRFKMSSQPFGGTSVGDVAVRPRPSSVSAVPGVAARAVLPAASPVRSGLEAPLRDERADSTRSRNESSSCWSWRRTMRRSPTAVLLSLSQSSSMPTRERPSARRSKLTTPAWPRDAPSQAMCWCAICSVTTAWKSRDLPSTRATQSTERSSTRRSCAEPPRNTGMSMDSVHRW